MLLAAFLRFRSFSIVCGKNGVKIREGVFLKKTSYIAVSKLSSVQTVQNPLDAVFGAVTYCVNTEAGKKGKTDFKFKLSLKNSKKVSELLYGKSDYTAVSPQISERLFQILQHKFLADVSNRIDTPTIGAYVPFLRYHCR